MYVVYSRVSAVDVAGPHVDHVTSAPFGTVLLVAPDTARPIPAAALLAWLSPLASFASRAPAPLVVVVEPVVGVVVPVAAPLGVVAKPVVVVAFVAGLAILLGVVTAESAEPVDFCAY